MPEACQKIRLHVVGKGVLSLFFLWFLFTNGLSQDSTYYVEAGVHPTKVIPLAARYQYPEFQPGFLYFTTGRKSDEFLLNYNLFAEQMQLIDSKGDTVALDNKASIVEFIQIHSDFYFRDFKQGYFLLLTNEGPLKLLKRTKWNNVIYPSGKSSYRKEYTFFFLAPRPNRVYKAERSALTKVFPNYKKEIKDYLSEHITDFTREAELKELVTFCNTLAFEEDHK